MRERIAQALRGLSLEGASAETIALSIALGLTLGVFPVYGCPTLLCLAATMALRPHLPLLHSINFLTSPLQLALILPFHRVGDRMLPATTRVDPGYWHFAISVYGFTSRVVTGWLLVCVPLGAALYVVLTVALRRYGRQERSLQAIVRMADA